MTHIAKGLVKLVSFQIETSRNQTFHSMASETGSNFLDRLVERLDRLDPASVQNYVLKLVRDKGFLETIFNTIHEGIIVIGRDLRIRYVNAVVRDLLGIPEKAEGQALDRYLPDVDWNALMDANTEEWRRVSFQEIEVFYPRYRILTFYLVPHSEQQADQIPLATLIFHDVTETRKNTERAIESETVEAITKLAAGVAHEIGNPLNSLTIHLQLLVRQLDHLAAAAADVDEAKDLVNTSLQEVGRLDSIVNNFLRAIRPVPPDTKPVRLQDILGEVLRFMRMEIEDRRIRVEAALPDKLPRIQGDPAQLKQAFYNIIKNSVQSMADEGTLSIVCDSTDDFVDVMFSDTGCGISRDNLSHIMEPYYTTRPDGSGLGLLVVERIMRSHGAEFGIDSREGEGTVFRMRFPLRERHVRLLEAPQHVSNKNDRS